MALLIRPQFYSGLAVKRCIGSGGRNLLFFPPRGRVPHVATSAASDALYHAGVVFIRATAANVKSACFYLNSQTTDRRGFGQIAVRIESAGHCKRRAISSDVFRSSCEHSAFAHFRLRSHSTRLQLRRLERV